MLNYSDFQLSKMNSSHIVQKFIHNSDASFLASASLSFHPTDHQASCILFLIVDALFSQISTTLFHISSLNLFLAVAQSALYKLLYSDGEHIHAILAATSSSFSADENQYFFIAVFS